MIIYQVDHLTSYDYSIPVVISHHLAHIEPREVPRQKWLNYQLTITPEPAVTQERVDFFGNRSLAFCLEEEHLHFAMKISGAVEVSQKPPPASSMAWEDAVTLAGRPLSAEALEVAMYCYPSPLAVFDESVRHYALASFLPGRPVYESCYDLMSRIYRDCRYTPSSTRIGTLPHEILRERRGVCQDFAHLMIACLRSLQLPCRYVSGYLLTRPPEGQVKLTGADATHAWVAAYIPGHGWVEFDPTNNCLGGQEHIIVAWGRDFGDVSPLKGVLTGGGPHTLKVAVNVEERSPLP